MISHVPNGDVNTREAPLPLHIHLNFDIRKLPPDTLLDERQAAAALTLKTGTLAVWRCTGRHDLKFVKIGRLVRYRAGDLLAWMENRTRSHSG